MRINSNSEESRKRFEEYYCRKNGITNPKNYQRLIRDAYNASHSLCGPYPENSYRSVEKRK